MLIQKKRRRRSRLAGKYLSVKETIDARIEAARGYPRLRGMFQERTGYAPDFKNPKTFNEKVNWRKLYDRNPLYPIVSDKLRVRDYVQDVLGPEAKSLFPKLYAVYRNGFDIDLAQLPDNVVLKANHASGCNAFLREGEPVDLPRLQRAAQSWMTDSYGAAKHEWAYQVIPRRILAEELLPSSSGPGPNDLKFNMFRDRLGWIQIDQGLFGDYRQDNIDENWARMPFQGVVPPSDALPPQPDYFPDMLQLARQLGSRFDYVRVDFLYNENGYWLNELTLYRGSGMNAFHPAEYDRTFGDMWELPDAAG